MADPVTIAVNIAIAAATTAISNALAPTQKFEGPRLDELRVQTSTYGKFKPIPFSKIAYAGNVFWLENNEIKETKHKESTGKGGPKTETTTYTYSATFAVALGDKEIAGISKIWADNKLIYDKTSSAEPVAVFEGDELASNITIYLGSETQEVNARIEADDPETPAYRGTPYVLFEDFQLGKFGNRIPNLTFEVSTSGSDDVFRQSSSFMSPYPAAGTFKQSFVADSGIFRHIFHEMNVGGAGQLNRISYILTYDVSGNIISNAQRKWTTLNEAGSVVIEQASHNSDSFALHQLGGTNAAVYENGAIAFEIKNPLGGDDNYAIDLGTGYGQIGRDVYIVGRKSSTSPAGEQYLARYYLDSTTGHAIQHILNPTSTDLSQCIVDAENEQVYLQTDAGEIYQYDADLNYIRTITLAANVYAGTTFAVSNDIIIGQASNFNILVQQINDDGSTTVLEDTPEVSAHGGSWYKISQTLFFADNRAGLDGGLWVLNSFDPSSVTLDDVVSELCSLSGLTASDINVTELTDTVDGYVISSLGSLKSAIEPLQIAYQFDVLESDYKLKFVKRGGASVVTLTEEDLAAHEYGQDRGDELPVERGKESELPRETKVSYISAARDYEPDMEPASRLVTESEQVNEINLPIVMTAAKAAQVAEIVQTVRWIERNTYPEFTLPYKYSYLEPSAIITINLRGITHQIRITQTDLGRPGLLKCSGVADKTAHYTSTAIGNAGQASTQTLTTSGPTNLVLLDLPMLRDQDNDSGFYIAAGGYYSGWPGCAIMKSSDGGQSYTEATSIVNETTIGYLTAAPTTGDTTVIDTENTINVKLFNGNTLSSVTEIAMLNGANAAAIGVDGRWVLIKFQTATLEGDGSYTLSNIIWGYKGTEHNLSSLDHSDTFVLLSTALIRLPANDNEIGSERHYKGVTLGKNIASATAIAFTNNAESLEPYAPTHITGSRDGSSNLTVDWVRRTRLGGEWRDYVNASLSEATEAYEIDFTVGGTTVTKTGITSPTYSYTASAQTTDFGSPQSSIITNIYQISATTGRGRVGTATL